MKIVVDTNILFSFFWDNSITKRLLSTSNFELISPEISLDEIKKYSDEICNRLKITKQKFEEQLKKLKENIKFIRKEEYSHLIKEAESFSPDKTDAEFFALCIKYSCFFWSNDFILKKQDKIKVFSTKEVIDLIF